MNTNKKVQEFVWAQDNIQSFEEDYLLLNEISKLSRHEVNTVTQKSSNKKKRKKKKKRSKM